MNLQRPNSGESTHTANRSKDVVPCSGICTVCVDGCQGNCEIFKAVCMIRAMMIPGMAGKNIGKWTSGDYKGRWSECVPAPGVSLYRLYLYPETLSAAILSIKQSA